MGRPLIGCDRMLAGLDWPVPSAVLDCERICDPNGAQRPRMPDIEWDARDAKAQISQHIRDSLERRGHVVSGLITQRSQVQILLPLPVREAQVRGGSWVTRSRLSPFKRRLIGENVGSGVRRPRCGPAAPDAAGRAQRPTTSARAGTLCWSCAGTGAPPGAVHARHRFDPRCRPSATGGRCRRRTGCTNPERTQPPQGGDESTPDHVLSIV
jgi:hypothetical protein